MNTRTMKAIGFGIGSYVLLYLLYALADFLPKWDAYGYSILKSQPVTGYAFVDPLLLVIPIIGFVGAWLVMDAYWHHFKDRFFLSVPFALIFVITSYLAFFVVLVGYFWNNAFLVAQSRNDPSAGFSSLGPALDFVMQNFMDFLLKSPFFLMVLAALAGWVSYWLIHSVLGESLPGTASANPSPLEPTTQHN